MNGGPGAGARTIFGRGLHVPGGLPAVPAPRPPQRSLRAAQAAEPQDLDPALAAMLLGARSRLSRRQWFLVYAALALGISLLLLGYGTRSSITTPAAAGPPQTVPVLAPVPVPPSPAPTVGKPAARTAPRARRASIRPARTRAAPVRPAQKIDLDGPLPPSF
jgi:hypothetical protein